MYKPFVVLASILLFAASSSFAQVRNGWRSIYDKDGRLSRMNFFRDGINLSDSNFFFQYHTDNVLKGIVNGEITADAGCTHGSVSLFDYSEQLAHYHIKKLGSQVFNCDLKDNGNYSASWMDMFDVNTGFWQCDSFSVAGGDLVLHNKKTFQTAIYQPQIAYDLNKDFIIRLKVPITNSSSQGIAIGWENEKNNLQFELQSGKYFTIKSTINGNTVYFANKQEYEKKSDGEADIVIKQINNDLIFQINGNIEKILPRQASYKSSTILLFTHAKEDTKFSEFYLNYELKPDDQLFSKLWVGKGTGFYISSDGKILTTYDNIANAKKIRVTGIKNGAKYTLPAKVIRTEEDLNLALLQTIEPRIAPFETLPIGYTDHVPASDSKIYSVGYPNSISGIFMPLEVFEGVVLPSSGSSGNRLLQLNFRNGMVGAPVFDFNFNLLGICSAKGNELKYSEMIDFYANSRIIRTYMGKTVPRLESPHREKSYDEKYKVATEMVVIIESSVLGEKEQEEE